MNNKIDAQVPAATGTQDEPKSNAQTQDNQQSKYMLQLPLYTNLSDKAPTEKISLDSFISKAKKPSVGSKSKAQAITPYLANGKTKKDALSAKYHAIVVDHDDDDLNREQLCSKYDEFNINYIAFTTSSHQQDKNGITGNRWKVIIPLSKPIDCKKFSVLSIGITLLMNADAAQTRPQQVFFAPNKVCKTAPYDYIIKNDLAYLDTEVESSLLVEAIKAYKEKEAQKKLVATQASMKPKKGHSSNDSIISMVNEAYDIETVISSFGYKKDGKTYLSPFSTTGCAGVHIFDGERLYSHHGDSDPLSNLNHDGHSLDTFDVLCCLKHDGDVSAAIQHYANELDRDGQKQRQRDYAEAKAQPEPIRLKGGVTPMPFDFGSFSLNGSSSEMRQQMLDDKFVLNGIAILGQATALYAKPNSGKTLLTIHLICEGIKSGELNAEDVFYVNADDNFKGIVTKLEIAEKYKFNMLAPGFNGFNVNEFSQYMDAMIRIDQCQGKVIILDTLKKFTNIMDKKVSSDFGKVMRGFVSKGGTMILLAHTNKNRDNDGKVVFSGTSDIVDDVDCAYTIDVTEGSDGLYKTVVFENIKSRGDVEQDAAFKYLNKVTNADGGYSALLTSVSRVSEQQAQLAKSLVQIQERLDKNASIIDAIKEALESGEMPKTDLIETAHRLSGVSKERVTRALNAHTGKDWTKGHRWSKRKGEKHSYLYRLITDYSGDDALTYEQVKYGE
ncbi:AAA family ATPase [Brumicola blandensis]|uniref:AAA family ATPase n=1 Tax=Brumicola blandensis TaxID=3075611 RepID=A0AAW8QXD3_9ALTE|nr:AAA family ATPase [Alteromonas sp. W409]MDT0581439.1 AAA family ATPase [Alteromonas sp. W409]